MTRLTPLWSQSGDYPASIDRQLIKSIWPLAGVNGMAAAIVPETMQIQIAEGYAVIHDANGEGAWLCVSDAPERVAIGTAPASGQNRTDLVAVAVADGDDPAWSFQVIPGTPSTGPAPGPAAPPGTVAICYINVLGGSAVLNGLLTDWRRSPGPPVGAITAIWPDITVQDGQTIGPQLSAIGGVFGGFTIVGGQIIIPRTGAYDISLVARGDAVLNGPCWGQVTLIRNGQTFFGITQDNTSIPNQTFQYRSYSATRFAQDLAAGDAIWLGFSAVTGPITFPALNAAAGYVQIASRGQLAT